jgi:hypothetical protein
MTWLHNSPDAGFLFRCYANYTTSLAAAGSGDRHWRSDWAPLRCVVIEGGTVHWQTSGSMDMPPRQTEWRCGDGRRLDH